jgi:hypothetical protein
VVPNLSLFLPGAGVDQAAGNFLYRVYERKSTFLDPVLRPIERLIYGICGVDDTREMDWKGYGLSMILFSGVPLFVLFLIERTQQWLPWNPQKLPNLAPDLAWNTAVSFTTNTNWQAYVPESTMSYFTQMAGLAYHNFTSAAVGMALAIAVIRGVGRKESKTIGNFWVDTTRGLLWVLLPLCVVGALVLVSQGVVQNLRPYTPASLVEPQTIEKQAADGTKSQETVNTQVIAQGPVASQEAIKMLGTNGGGFFNTNSSMDGREIRKGAPEAIKRYIAEKGQRVPEEVQEHVGRVANSGGIQPRAHQSSLGRPRQIRCREAPAGKSWRGHSYRRRHFVRLRPRSRDFSRSRRIPDSARSQSSRHQRRLTQSAGCPSHAGPNLRHLWRAPRKRPRIKPGSRFPEVAESFASHKGPVRRGGRAATSTPGPNSSPPPSAAETDIPPTVPSK